METPSGHLTLKDIAREAGVSVATIDRVLHGRSGVRADTARRVREAIDAPRFPTLDGRRANSRAGRPMKFAFVMPTGANVFMQMILDHIARNVGLAGGPPDDGRDDRNRRIQSRTLAQTLESLHGRYDGVAVVALDHQSVRAAIDDLVASGTFVVTLVSDVPGSRRHHYVGIDNVAAGRTAGTLIGRLVARALGQGRRHRRLAIAARSRRANFRFQPGDKSRISAN